MPLPSAPIVLIGALSPAFRDGDGDRTGRATETTRGHLRGAEPVFARERDEESIPAIDREPARDGRRRGGDHARSRSAEGVSRGEGDRVERVRAAVLRDGHAAVLVRARRTGVAGV